MSSATVKVNSPDFAIARRFIELLTRDPDTPMHVRAIRHSDMAAESLPAAPLAELKLAIRKAQLSGYGAFPVVNEGGHEDADIIRIRSLFIDVDDGRSPDEIEWHLEPSFLVQTARGWHAYWLVDDTVTVNDFRQLQRRLAAYYGSDASVSNLSRVMRLPGTLHLKDPNNPQLVTLKELSGETYDAGTVQEGLPEIVQLSERLPTALKGYPVPAADLEMRLGFLDPFTPRGDWWKIVAAIRCTPVPNDDDESVRQDIAVRWSRGDIPRAEPLGSGRWFDWIGVYTDDDDVVREFETVKLDKIGGATFGTIFELAKQAGCKEPPPRPPGAETFKGVIAGAGAAGDDITVELTEHGIIEAFTHRYRGELVFDHTVQAWFRFDGNYWRREDTKLAQHYAHKVSVELADSLEAGEDRAKVRAAMALKRVHVWEAVERGARTKREFSVTAERWNKDKMLLGTPGGTVDLRTGELRKGRAEDYISRVTAVAPIPLDEFKPALHCPRWMMFLKEVQAGDEEAIRFLQQWGGYVLTGECTVQCFLFVYGVGQSGKSTTFNTIGEILGDYAKNAAPETFTASKHERHPEELARLHGARFVRASETAQGRVWDENRIKSMTGQDTITARFMRANSFEFVPEFKITIFGNNAPILKNPDSAMRRRMIVFPFDQAVPEERKNLNLPEHLKAEWQGILSWLIQGCLDWQANGLIRPAVALKATENYFEDQDTFGRFLTDHCELGKDYAVTTTELWAKWEPYARAAQADPGTRDRTFPEKLRQHRFESIKDTSGIRGRGWKGLRLAIEW